MTQEEVDNFIIDYPNCTELETLLIGDIIESTVTNLDGLINLEDIGWLQLTNTPIINLQGLNNVTHIDILSIAYNSTLLSLNGLDNLSNVGALRIDSNPNLLNLQGLENLTTIEERLYVYGNSSLENISHLYNLETIGELGFEIIRCPAITSLTGLENLETIEGDFKLTECHSITNFIGLENLTSIGGDTFFVDINNNLNDITGLNCFFFSEDFRNNIDNYTLQSSLYQSVFDNCGIQILSNNDYYVLNETVVYPNPATEIISVKNSGNIECINIIDLSGRFIKKISSGFINIDISDISAGTYLLNILFANNVTANKKIIIN